MIGAIAGDIIGSVHEFIPIKTKEFPLFTDRSFFTDDSVLTIAIADSILHKKPYDKTLQEYGRYYPNAGFGTWFIKWIHQEKPEPYNSFGNGSAMRVSPAGYAFDDWDSVLNAAKETAEVTHNHPEGIKGAQATAASIFLARSGKSKKEIKETVEKEFGYDLSAAIHEIRPEYSFSESCQETVPQAITAFLESDDFEDAIRNAISLGGDADTLACIAGGIAQAFYKKISEDIIVNVTCKLDSKLKAVLNEFNKRYDVTF